MNLQKKRNAGRCSAFWAWLSSLRPQKEIQASRCGSGTVKPAGRLQNKRDVIHGIKYLLFIIKSLNKN
jgi:hypothetical protein